MQEKITVNVNFADNNAFTVFKKDLTAWIDAWVDTRAKNAHAQELATKLTAEQTKIRASFIGHQVTDDMHAGSLTTNALCEFITNSCVDKIKYSTNVDAIIRTIHFYGTEFKFKAIGKLVASILRKEPKRGVENKFNVDKLVGYLTAYHNAVVEDESTSTQPSDVAVQIGKRVTELLDDDMLSISELIDILYASGYVGQTIVHDELRRMAHDGQFKRIGKRIKYMVENGSVNANLLELKLKESQFNY